MIKVEKEKFIKICNESSTMAEAARKMNLYFTTFRKYAKLFNCYMPNQSGKGTNKNIKRRILDITEYKCRASVRELILKSDLLEYKCGLCGIDTWNNETLSLHLDHINGISIDHRLENLRWLCPNCHSQTSTYTGRNRGKNKHI